MEKLIRIAFIFKIKKNKFTKIIFIFKSKTNTVKIDFEAHKNICYYYPLKLTLKNFRLSGLKLFRCGYEEDEFYSMKIAFLT